MNTQIIIAALIGGAVGAAISGIFTLISQILNRRSEERKFILEMCHKTALENWHSDKEYAKAVAASGKGPIAISPIDLYLIHMIALNKLIAKGSLSQEQMIKEWVAISESTKAAYEEAKKRQPYV